MATPLEKRKGESGSLHEDKANLSFSFHPDGLSLFAALKALRLGNNFTSQLPASSTPLPLSLPSHSPLWLSLPQHQFSLCHHLLVYWF